MIKFFDYRFFVFIGLCVFYSFTISSINTLFADYVYIMLPAIYIVPVALVLGFKTMIFTLFFCGLFLEASSVYTFGYITSIWLILGALIKWFNFDYNDTTSFISTMLLVNIVAIVCMVLVYPIYWDLEFFKKIFVDTLVSNLIIVSTGKFFLNFALWICGILKINEGNKIKY